MLMFFLILLPSSLSDSQSYLASLKSIAHHSRPPTASSPTIMDALPLSARKQVVMTVPAGGTHNASKRSATAPDEHPVKRSKLSFQSILPSSTPVRFATPESTSSPTYEGVFKIPEIPVRALTPSTSTVAYSSSPRPALSSSPIRAPPALRKSKKVGTTSKSSIRPQETLDVQLELGTALVFGRHRHRPSGSSSSSKGAREQTDLKTSIPAHLQHLTHDLQESAQIVHLSRYASHASRVHALLQYLKGEDKLRVLVVGQNGLKIGGKRILQGQRVDLARRDQVVIDFYGAIVNVTFPGGRSVAMVEQPVIEERRERLFTPGSSEADIDEQHRESLRQLSLPPSSPPMAPMDLDDDMSLASSPLSNPASEDEAEAEAPTRDVKEEMIEIKLATPPAPEVRRVSPLISESPKTVKPLPEGIDLPALLASTVVFSGSSKLSLPDLVKHMLEASPLS